MNRFGVKCIQLGCGGLVALIGGGVALLCFSLVASLVYSLFV